MTAVNAEREYLRTISMLKRLRSTSRVPCHNVRYMGIPNLDGRCPPERYAMRDSPSSIPSMTLYHR